MTKLVNGRTRQQYSVLSIVMDSRTTKAVCLQANPEGIRLTDFIITDGPCVPEKRESLTVEQLTQHFTFLRQKLSIKPDRVVIVLNWADSILRYVEVPPMPMPLLRGLLSEYGRSYSQEDLTGYTFDCCEIKRQPNVVMPATETTFIERVKPGDLPKNSMAPLASMKAKFNYVLFAGAKTKRLHELHLAAIDAGMDIDLITTNQVAQANAVMLMDDFIHKQPVITLDIGFQSTRICIVDGGEILVSRVVEFGGDHLTHSLAKEMDINYAAAEGLKQVTLNKVEEKLNHTLAPLINEIKMSIDFFHDRYNRHMHAVYVFGSTAQSKLILQIAAKSLNIPVNPWALPASLSVHMTPAKVEELKLDAPKLGLAIGAGLCLISPEANCLNLLAQKQLAAEQQRQDPIPYVFKGAILLVGLMFGWSVVLASQWFVERANVRGHQQALTALIPQAEKCSQTAKTLANMEKQQAALAQHIGNRVLWANVLDALQHVMVENITVTHLTLEQTVNTPALRKPGSRLASYATLTLKIQAKDYADPKGTDRFIEAILANPFLKQRIKGDQSVTLKDRVPKQVDINNPSKAFALVTIECVFQEHLLGYE